MDTILTFILTLATMFFTWFLSDPTSSTAVVPVDSDSEIAQVIEVTDGDTIKVQLGGQVETVRYIGVDTPEPYRDGEPACYSFEASEFNKTLVAGQEVVLVGDVENRDRYDRLLRYVYVDDVFVNQLLIKDGYATALTIEPNTAFSELFQELELDAELAGVGLWSTCRSVQDDVRTLSNSQENILIEEDRLTDGQQRLLQTIGVDTSSLVVTPTMISCAEEAVGADRVEEIKNGDTPSLLEGIKLTSCYRQ